MNFTKSMTLSFFTLNLTLGLLSASSGIADVSLTPHKTSYCVATVSTYANRNLEKTNNRILYTLRDFRIRVENKAGLVRGGTPWVASTDDEKLEAIKSYDSDIVLVGPLKDGDEAKKQFTFAANRLRALEKDVIYDTPTRKVLYQEIRGKDAILTHLELSEKGATQVEKYAEEQINKEFPFWKSRKGALVKNAANLAFYGGFAGYDFAHVPWTHMGANLDTGIPLVAGAVLTYWGRDTFKQTWRYAKSLFNKNAKIEEENRSPLRITDILKANQAVRDSLAQTEPTTKYVYYGFNAPVTPELRESVLEEKQDANQIGADTTASIKEGLTIPAGAGYARSDSFFYYDADTKEPVLVTATRI